jgi:hypothetical protein
VRNHGFDWEHKPITVDRHYSLRDGAHRVAMALALRHQHHRIGIHRDCWSRDFAPPGAAARPQNLDFVQSVLGGANRDWLRQRARSLLLASAHGD